jgi:hypothetical protein
VLSLQLRQQLMLPSQLALQRHQGSPLVLGVLLSRPQGSFDAFPPVPPAQQQRLKRLQLSIENVHAGLDGGRVGVFVREGLP